MPAPAPSLARGVGLFVLLLTVGMVLRPWVPTWPRPVPPPCGAPVEVLAVGSPRARLGCANEVALQGCAVAAFDRVVLSTAGCTREAGGMRGAWRLALGAPLDLNRATARELASLDGLGARLAAAVVADREAQGRFPDVGALRRVPGIGPKKAAALAPHLMVH